MAECTVELPLRVHDLRHSCLIADGMAMPLISSTIAGYRALASNLPNLRLASMRLKAGIEFVMVPELPQSLQVGSCRYRCKMAAAAIAVSWQLMLSLQDGHLCGGKTSKQPGL